MDVSVIIVNYNTKELTKNCIDSIFVQTSGVTFEVILVDNASTDGSVELFKKDGRICFVESGCNLGFGKANNLGYQYAMGKYIFLLNSDTILLNNALKLFFDKMESAQQNIGCMGCLLQDLSGKYVHSYAELPSVDNVLGTLIWKSFFSFWGFDIQKMDDPETKKVNPSFFQVEYVTGADLFLRRTVIEKCGFFDPDFFMYYEDSELQYRFTKHNYLSYIYDIPKIVHLEGHSSKKDSTTKRLILLDGTLRYMSKTQDCWKVILLRFLMLIKSPYMIRVLGFNMRESRDYLRIIIGGHMSFN